MDSLFQWITDNAVFIAAVGGVGSLVAGAAALITALVALFNVREVRRARETAYAVNPAFQPFYFYAYWLAGGHKSVGSIPVVFSEQNVSLNEAPGFLQALDARGEHSSREPIKAECFNLGFGVARDVLFTWSFDPLAFARVVGEREGTDRVRILMSQAKPSRGSFAVRGLLAHSGRSSGIQHISNEVRIKVTHLIHRHDGQPSERIALPDAYLDLLAALLYVSAPLPLSDPKRQGLSLWPQSALMLRLQMDYSDIGGRRHSQTFEFIPSLNWGRLPLLGYEFARMGEIEMLMMPTNTFDPEPQSSFPFDR